MEECVLSVCLDTTFCWKYFIKIIFKLWSVVEPRIYLEICVFTSLSGSWTVSWNPAKNTKRMIICTQTHLAKRAFANRSLCILRFFFFFFFVGPTTLFTDKPTLIKHSNNVLPFKNYFAVVFSTLSFQQNKQYPNRL